MLGPLFWSGESGVAANIGVKPKLYTPTPYQEGSSITHLDEDTFANSLTNSAMTPNLEPGEVFRTPGPIALGMIQDMMKAPPARSAAGIPAKPVNVKALVGDGYALLTFDSPNCSRIDRANKILVTTSPGDITKSFSSSPIRIGGLKNGRQYKFTLVAENEIGRSGPVESNSVKPQGTPVFTTIDPFSRVSSASSVSYRGVPTVIYGDEATRSLKIATFSGKKWFVSKIQKNVDVGPISLCKTGVGAKESLHIFYGETGRKDLMHSYFRAGKWAHETIDGNGLDVQDYREKTRRTTASDVSVSNACVFSSQGLQVFYRDESQGLLLGAVNTPNGWLYEIVDGDSNMQGRTTGDVAFTISATSVEGKVYLFYNSVLAINSNKEVISGEVRLASRETVYPEDWQYQSIDGPENGTFVAGYATQLIIHRNKVMAVWMSSDTFSTNRASQISLVDVDYLAITKRIGLKSFGVPSGPLAFGKGQILFGCQSRVCATSVDNYQTKLLHGVDSAPSTGITSEYKGKTMVTLVSKNKVKYSWLN